MLPTKIMKLYPQQIFLPLQYMLTQKKYIYIYTFRNDTGTLVDKEVLPVKKMVFSVTGTSTVDIGPLRCLGQLLKLFVH